MKLYNFTKNDTIKETYFKNNFDYCLSKKFMKKTLYLLAGHSCIIVGTIGVFLPVLPTVPFILLAAFFYSKSSTKLHHWLITHKYFGKPLRDWEKNGAISLKAKLLATLMIALVIIFRLPYLKAQLNLKVILISILFGVLLYIWSRPHK